MNILKLSKKKIALFVAIILAVLVTVGLVIHFAFGNQSESKWVSEKYTYENLLPGTEEPEDWINLDGVISEAQWQDNTWLSYSSYGVTFKVTTEFTEKGMYIAANADDPYVYFDGDYEYNDSTYFKIYIIREDEESVDPNSNSYLVRPGRRINLSIDPVNTESFTNAPVTSAVSVRGTLNTSAETERHETDGWSFELFISWESIQLEDEYFAEDGIPNNMRMFIGYNQIDGENANRINNYIDPLNTEDFRFSSYWLFGRQGLEGDYTSLLLNNAEGGPAATEQLSYSIDDDGDLVITNNVPRAQFTWAQGPMSENYLIEATFTLGEFTDRGNFGVGFISFDSASRSSGYSIFTAKADDLKHSDTLIVNSTSYTDSLQWIGHYGIYETVSRDYHSPYGEDSVRLKLIKVGGYMYYFVDNQFVKAEYLDRLKGAVNVGLFFNVRASATDYRYVDYSDNVEELVSEVGEYVHFINVPGVTSSGSITSDKSVVTKGDSVTININPAGSYIVGDIYNNGVSIYDQVVGSTLTFTPTDDVNITADYHRLDSDSEVCKLTLKLTDENGEAVTGVTYTLTESNGQVVYTGQDNGRGRIIVSVPRKGIVQTKTQQVTFSGNYTLTVEKDGYISASYQIQTGDAAEYEESFVINDMKYGSVTVNGSSTSDKQGTFEYSHDKGLYYSPVKTSSGREIAYHSDYIANEYAFTVTISSETAPGTPNVPGVVISNGRGETIILKVSPWGPNQLFISNGRREVSVTGFAHTHSAAGGTATFTVVRKEDNVYIFDCNGDLGVILTNAGIQLMGNHKLQDRAYLSVVNESVSDFFAKSGQDNAAGIYSDYNNGSANTYFDIQWTNDTAAINKALKTVSYIPVTFPTDDKVASVEYRGAYDSEWGFVSGATGYVNLENADAAQAVHQLIIKYANGSSQTVPANYNSSTGNSEFTFTLTKPCSGVEYQYGTTCVVSGNISGIEDVSRTQVVFFDTATGAQFSTYCNNLGNYSIKLFASTYNILATKDQLAAYTGNVNVNSNVEVDLKLETQKYHMGEATINGIGVNSSAVVGMDTLYDALDGKVTVPANDATMIGILSNQIYTGADSFTYSIKVSGNNIPYSSGTPGSGTQIGLGLTDGTNWWVIFVKNGENQGKSVGIGVWRSGAGGGDFVYKTDTSPNKVLVDSAAGTLSADVVLTIEKTASSLTLYAGEGNDKVKIFTATASGYQFADDSGTISNTSTMEAQYSKMAGFFDPDNEFALCLGSFYYNADVTFQLDVQ